MTTISTEQKAKQSSRSKAVPDYTAEKILAEPPAKKRRQAAALNDDGDSDCDPKTVVEAKPTKLVPISGKFDSVAVAAKFPGFKIATGPVTREEPGGRFKFQPPVGATAAEVAAAAAFRPNRSPEEVLRAGAFGGTYFRTIDSGVVKATLSGAWKELPASWIEGLEPSTHLARPWAKYNAALNKYGVKSGTTLEDWEGSGWITKYDPFGWFQWYCRYFQGRRCPDDERQIGKCFVNHTVFSSCSECAFALVNVLVFFSAANSKVPWK